MKNLTHQELLKFSRHLNIIFIMSNIDQTVIRKLKCFYHYANLLRDILEMDVVVIHIYRNPHSRGRAFFSNFFRKIRGAAST